MKKIFLGICLISLLFLTGCGSVSEKGLRNGFIKEVDGLKSYQMKGELSLTNNDDVYKYDVEVAYKKDDNYRVKLLNKANSYEQIILRNDEGVYVVTPSLNKSFKFQSEWPYNNSQAYLLNSVANDLKEDDNYSFEQKDKDYVFTTKVNYPNNKSFTNQKITLDKDKNLKKVEVIDKDGVVYIEFVVSDLDKKPTFNDDYFKLETITEDFSMNSDNNGDTANNNIDSSSNDGADSKNGDTNSSDVDGEDVTSNENSNSNDVDRNSTTNENTDNSDANRESNALDSESRNNSSTDTNSNEKTNQTASIDESVFPLYLPTNTSLSNKEVIDTDNGKRVIMTFAGDNPFILVEETVSKASEHTIVPTYGEPFMLIDTVGSLTDVSYTWTSNGVEYYIVSDTMDQSELLEVAKSINVVNVVSQK